MEQTWTQGTDKFLSPKPLWYVQCRRSMTQLKAAILSHQLAIVAVNLRERICFLMWRTIPHELSYRTNCKSVISWRSEAMKTKTCVSDSEEFIGRTEEIWRQGETAARMPQLLRPHMVSETPLRSSLLHVSVSTAPLPGRARSKLVS